MIQEKICQNCGGSFQRTYKVTDWQWEARKFCSLKCSAAVNPPPRSVAGPLSPRIWANVTVGDPNECWPWTGSRDDKEYGLAKNGDQRLERAHRIVYRLCYGEIPTETPLVLHSCDNPPCCNPLHLFAGTHKSNAHDRDKKGRAAIGVRAGRAKLNDDAVRRIRESTSHPTTLAELYGVSAGVIYAVQARRTWRHVP